jgi:hypothetical protein
MSIIAANRYRYQYVPPGVTAAVLGINGGPGDYLARLIVTTNTPNNAAIMLIDGPTIIPLQVGAAQLGHGPATIELGIASQHGPWMITTGAGAGVIAVGETGL